MIVDGVDIEVAWVGAPRGGPRADLVFLHEGLGSISQWRETPAAIAAASERAALVYARPGYGRSSPVAVPRPLSYMHDEADRLPHVLAAAGVAADAVLVGHSDGASIAIIAAGRGLVAPRAIVLIAPHVFVEDVALSSIAAARDAYRDGDLRPRLARNHADVDGAFWGWNRAWLDPGFRSWNLEAFLPSITAPTLVVQGAADEYGTLVQVERVVAGMSGPCETLVVPGAGHSPHRSHAVAVHEGVSAFIRRVAP